ncbi:MAG: exodeoxyribonuclease V subunit beta [Gammaproteobacteria bacterium]|nr:exodeoxyribonuclease V subunit beta [Gammaproteobacteria bacterium]
MTQTSQVLAPLALPLRGPALIEASAGTGKTYTLAMLYLRLILNHGGEAALGEALLPHNILVVTFTKAATQELRDRIRRRLVMAAAYLRGNLPAQGQPAESQEVDALLQQLCASYTEPKQQAGAAKRLEMAAEAMDEAAISTIHSWCYRLLNEFSLYYGGAFEQQLLESETELLKEISEDFWRLNVLGMSHDSLAYMMQRFKCPALLLQEVQKLLPHVASLAAPVADLDAYIQQQQAQKQTLVASLKGPLAANLQRLQQFFAEARAQGLLHSGKLQAKHEASAFAALQKYIQTDEVNFKPSAPATIKKLALLDTSIWQQPELLDRDFAPAKCVARVLDFDAPVPNPDATILTFAAHWLQQRLTHSKQQQGWLSNDDLLIHLQQALSGTGGEQLAQAIRHRFPIALVDEFQDTDPVQYDIFNRIYRIREGCPSGGFIMIGDPKQAIYAFRGGDIYTYLQARNHTFGHHYTLTHNYRSDSQLIAAVNGLFAYGDSHAQGAFRLRQPSHNPLPFLPVQAGTDKPQQLYLQGQTQAPQTAWLTASEKAGKLLKNKDYLASMSAATANEIARLLNLSAVGQAVLQTGDQQQPLQPKHLAILVANKKQATAVREALAQRQIASVYLSDASSVYTSAIAQDLLLLLRAVADPDDDRLLSMALATRLLGLDVAALDRLQRDELAWEQQLHRFYTYHQIWQSKGVLPLVYQVIFDSQAAVRIRAMAGGERLLTDLLHLAELLQQAAVQLDGEHSLVRHFETLLEHPDQQDGKQQQRLESDSNLVQVVTIHKSKGLEYPVVFLPFVCLARAPKAEDMPLIYHTGQQQKKVALEADKAILAEVEKQHQAEEIRKLYVALTRASCCQYLGLGEVSSLAASGFGSVLMLTPEAGNLAADLQPFTDFLSLQPLPEEQQWTDHSSPTVPARTARQAPAINLQNWYTASYSGLTFGGLTDAAGAVMAAPSASDTAQDAILAEEQQNTMNTGLEPDQTGHRESDAVGLNEQLPSIYNLPKGALFGTMLHDILEACAELGFAEVVADRQGRQKILTEHLQPLTLEPWLGALDRWLVALLKMPWQLQKLGAEPMQLQALSASQLLVEMEFLCAAKQVDVQALDRLVCQYSWQQRPRPQAQAQQLNGMLKGYIDLLIEHQGQYFVVDWKSNYLGADASAYSADALREALLHKRYDMQYLLYILALHRLLKSRLPDYNYKQHIGGAVYVFLRGIDNADTQGLLQDKPEQQLIESLDRIFQGRVD